MTRPESESDDTTDATVEIDDSRPMHRYAVPMLIRKSVTQTYTAVVTAADAVTAQALARSGSTIRTIPGEIVHVQDVYAEPDTAEKPYVMNDIDIGENC